MHLLKDILVPGTDNRMMGLDIFFDDGGQPLPIVIYVHGFNGFKDWGNFDLIAKKFVMAGYVFVKFNFSHNGTSPDHPRDFVDLEAFGNNNYTTELNDLRLVINWVCNPMNTYQQIIDKNRIYLIGHSMGGGISILQAAEDSRVKKLITWAGISECKTPWGNWPANRIVEWKQTGVQYYINSRTEQQMPLFYQLYEDFNENKERLDIKNAIKKLKIPILICHGTNDTAVAVEEAFELKKQQQAAQLFTVESDHVFGRKHLWLQDVLPPATESVVGACLAFLK